MQKIRDWSHVLQCLNVPGSILPPCQWRATGSPLLATALHAPSPTICRRGQGSPPPEPFKTNPILFSLQSSISIILAPEQRLCGVYTGGGQRTNMGSKKTSHWKSIFCSLIFKGWLSASKISGSSQSRNRAIWSSSLKKKIVYRLYLQFDWAPGNHAFETTGGESQAGFNSGHQGGSNKSRWQPGSDDRCPTPCSFSTTGKGWGGRVLGVRHMAHQWAQISVVW